MKECENIKSRELIDDYIQGKLPESEQEALEQHYFECDRCFTELQAREKLIEVIQERGETIFAEYIVKRKPVRESFWADFLDRLFPKAPLWRQGWVYAAATAAVVLILVPLFSTLFGPNKYEHLADIKPYPYLLTGLRSGASDTERIFHEGMKLYTEEDYVQASQHLKEVVTKNPDNVSAHFFLGISFMMEENTGGAIQSLKRAATAQPDSEIFHWYLGQAYLKKGDGNKAIKEFEKVRDLDGEYRMRAEAMIRKIEEIKP